MLRRGVAGVCRASWSAASRLSSTEAEAASALQHRVSSSCYSAVRSAASGLRHASGCRCGCGHQSGRHTSSWTSFFTSSASSKAAATKEEAAQPAGGESASASGAGAAAGEGEESGEGPTVEELLQQLGDREAQLEDSVKQLGELKDKVLRAHADMENLRFRTAQQSDNAKRFAVQSFAKDLLDVADNLDRAMATLPADVAAAAEAGTPPAGATEGQGAVLHQLAVGVSLTARTLAKTLAKHGCVRFEPKAGEALDPHTMAALFQVPPSPAASEKGTVAIVTKAGYKLNDRVIRPAEVGVVQG